MVFKSTKAKGAAKKMASPKPAEAGDSTAKTVDKKVEKVAKRKKTIQHNRNFTLPIYRVLKEIHSDIRISSKSVVIMNSLVLDILDKLLREGANLLSKDKRKQLSSADIESAVKLVFPGELAKHAIGEGTQAVNKYKNSKEAM